MTVWIGRIDIDPTISYKLRTKHGGVTEADVREAASYGSHERASWHGHPTFGRRLIVLGRNGEGRQLIIYLAAVDERDGHWECRTARWTKKEA
jgi:hypothetical protein